MRAISLVGFVAIGYLVIAGAYPVWLRGVQGLLLLAALVVVANLGVVRDAFPRVAAPARKPGNRWAALLLVVLTPVIADFSLGTVPIAMAWLVLLFVPVYGTGALLIRELVRRAGGGWGSLVLMGVAYGLLEEGLALQALTSVHLYRAADWAPRVFGVNSAYTELNLPHHVVFSVIIPIMLVELLFPRHGRQPYLRTAGVIVAGVITLLGAALLRLPVPLSEDPGYVVPLTMAITTVVLIAGLSVIALRVLPRRTGGGLAPVAPPSPAAVGLACGVTALAFVALLFPFGGARQLAFTHGMWVLVPMAVAAVLAVVVGLRLARWGAASTWTDRHRLAAIGAAVVANTVFGIVAKAHTIPNKAVLAALVIVAGVLLLRFDRHLREQATPLVDMRTTV